MISSNNGPVNTPLDEEEPGQGVERDTGSKPMKVHSVAQVKGEVVSLLGLGGMSSGGKREATGHRSWRLTTITGLATWLWDLTSFKTRRSG